MNDANSWQELFARLRVFLDHGAEDPTAWVDCWLHLVEHQGYVALLNRCARQMLREAAAPQAWQSDVVHDALLLLAKRLREPAAFAGASRLPRAEFTEWLERTAVEDCRRVLQLAPADGPQPASSPDYAVVRRAADRLRDPHRTVVSLALSGWSAQEIAHELVIPPGSADRLIRDGLRRLRRILLRQR